MLPTVHNLTTFYTLQIYILFKKLCKITKFTLTGSCVKKTTNLRCVLAKAGKWREINTDRPFQCQEAKSCDVPQMSQS